MSPQKITLGETTYELSPIPLVRVKKVVPVIVKFSQRQIEDLSEPDFDELIDAIALALRSAYPDTSADHLRKQPIRLDQLTKAMAQLSELVGLTA